MERNAQRLAELFTLAESLYTAASETDRNDPCLALLLAAIDKANSAIADEINRQSYQAGEIAMESGRNWQHGKPSNNADVDLAA